MVKVAKPVPFTVTRAGLWQCGACCKTFEQRRGLRRHANGVHHGPLAKPAPVDHKTAARRWFREKEKKRLGLTTSAVARCGATLDNGRGACDKRRVGTGKHARCVLHPVLGVADALSRGTYQCRDPIVELCVFPDPLGRGVVAVQRLREGDIVTQYCGADVDLSDAAVVHEYRHHTLTTSTRAAPIFGLMMPKRGKGIGSFVNACRGLHAVENVAYRKVGGVVFMKVTRDIAPGQQLFAVYGTGFKM